MDYGVECAQNSVASCKLQRALRARLSNPPPPFHMRTVGMNCNLTRFYLLFSFRRCFHLVFLANQIFVSRSFWPRILSFFFPFFFCFCPFLRNQASGLFTHQFICLFHFFSIPLFLFQILLFYLFYCIS